MLSILALSLNDDLQRLNALKVVLAGLVNLVAGIVFVFAAHVAWAAAGADRRRLGDRRRARRARRPAPVAEGAARPDRGRRDRRDRPPAGLSPVREPRVARGAQAEGADERACSIT